MSQMMRVVFRGSQVADFSVMAASPAALAVRERRCKLSTGAAEAREDMARKQKRITTWISRGRRTLDEAGMRARVGDRPAFRQGDVALTLAVDESSRPWCRSYLLCRLSRVQSAVSRFPPRPTLVPLAVIRWRKK